MMLFGRVLFAGLFLVGAAVDTAMLLEEARRELKNNQPEKALQLANQAVAGDAKSVDAYLLRGIIQSSLRHAAEAITDFDRTLALEPKLAEAYDRRGSEHFKLGHIPESIKDFDRFLKLEPGAEPGHWRRGIAFYYAGRYEDGRKQFEGYQGVDANDVENVVWRYLCMARQISPAKARAALLKVGDDRRVPMRQIYELFAGRATPADVLAACRAGQPTAEQLKQRLFYAHLYLALYCEAAGDQKATREHLTKVVHEYKVDGYMWDVANVHWLLLQKTDPRGAK
jgi:lipoprotein NlpI